VDNINQKKKVLITGVAGFIGHHLLEGVLKQTDWNVVGLDALTYAGDLNRISDIGPWEKEQHRFKFIWHDLRSPLSETIHKMIGEVDYIWHLAAETHIDKSLEDSVPFVQANVLGTANLLEYVKHYQPNLKKYVQFSTDECYGAAPDGIFFNEEAPLKPSNPYSASKAGADLLAYTFGHAFNLPIIITRCMNVFGERQYPEKFIPKTIKAILENSKVLIHGSPGEVSFRFWIHARNVADFLIFLMEKGELKQTYNIVGVEQDVLTIANMASQIIKGRPLADNEIEYINFHAARPGHDRRYALDGTKAKNLGWEPKLNFQESFEKMVKWMIKDENRRWLNL